VDSLKECLITIQKEYVKIDNSSNFNWDLIPELI